MFTLDALNSQWKLHTVLFGRQDKVEKEKSEEPLLGPLQIPCQ